MSAFSGSMSRFLRVQPVTQSTQQATLQDKPQTAKHEPPGIAPPRSDYGTIVLHWALAIAIIVSLFTGLRLSADAEYSVFAKSLEPILPQGEIWTWHFVSALVVVAGIFAYSLYLSMGRLKRRVSVKKTVVLTLPASQRLRWAAVNVIFYWVLFAAVAALTVTGVLLYIGHGGLVVDIHYISALFVGGYIVAHVFSHYMYGGLSQLLRLFRPQPLRMYRGMSAKPFAKAMTVGIVVAGLVAMTDFGTRDALVVPTVDALPKLDGRMDDAVWKEAEPVFVRTQQGVALGGSGESTVELRAVKTADSITFGFRWEDPSRSLKRLPLIKRKDGWHLLNNKADIADESAYYEDKFSVLFSKSNAFGSGDSTHMGRKPLADRPGSLHGRGLHYTTDGSLIDVWQWKAARGGLLGKVDDMWFGTPSPANAKHKAGLKRYSGGYGADKGKSFYVYNYKGQPPGGYRETVEVKRLPIDYASTVSKLGPIDLDVEATDAEGSQWWMFENETAPYSAELDAKIPVGTVIPGVLIQGKYEGSRADLNSGAKWQDGYWTLEVTRKLKTGNAQDLDMVSGLYIWVAVFDHNQTRHTRHVRPVRLDLR